MTYKSIFTKLVNENNSKKACFVNIFIIILQSKSSMVLAKLRCLNRRKNKILKITIMEKKTEMINAKQSIEELVSGASDIKGGKKQLQKAADQSAEDACKCIAVAFT